MHKVKYSSCELNSMIRTIRDMAYRYGQIGLTEPDDIVQSTMIKVLRKEDGREPNVFWLYKVVRSTALDAGRAASRDRRLTVSHPSTDLRLVCERADQYRELPCDAYIVREPDVEIDLMPRLKNMLGQLRPPLRQVLVLYSEGYSYQEIALMTKTNVGTVRSRLHYARRRAKDLMGDLA